MLSFIANIQDHSKELQTKIESIDNDVNTVQQQLQDKEKSLQITSQSLQQALDQNEKLQQDQTLSSSKLEETESMQIEEMGTVNETSKVFNTISHAPSKPFGVV